jgi:hypothetical protein
MLGFLKGALRKSRANVYGLDHAVLNIQLPPQTMWMNMGYWEVNELKPQLQRAHHIECLFQDTANNVPSTQMTSRKPAKHFWTKSSQPRYQRSANQP